MAMKGVAHFSIGVALASCFPAAVKAGLSGNPWYFMLGGVFGLLPDMLDSHFRRPLQKYHMEVVPDPLSPDPATIARAIAHAVTRAHFLKRPVRIKLNSIHIGPDRWHTYIVKFDIPNRRVRVAYGDIVEPGTSSRRTQVNRRLSAEAQLPCRARLHYKATLEIGPFDGPVLEMIPESDEAVVPRFLPACPGWSHSPALALLVAAGACAAWGCTAGLIALLAYAAHIITDQDHRPHGLLPRPFCSGRRARYTALQVKGAPSTFPAVWASSLLTFWNLYDGSIRHVPSLNPVRLFFYALVIPSALYLIARRIGRREWWAAR